jgi:hypothetical protein
MNARITVVAALCEAQRRPLAKHSQCNIENRDQGDAYRKACQHKFFSVL